MPSPEAIGNPEDNLYALIEDVTKTMQGDADVTGFPASAGMATSAPEGTGPERPVTRRCTVICVEQGSGDPRPARVEFSLYGTGEGGSINSPEAQALHAAVQSYVDEAREKRLQRQNARISDFPTIFDYQDTVDTLDDEVGELAGRADELHRIIDGFDYGQERPDGSANSVSVSGQDAITVHEALVHGHRLLAQEQSNGDESAYERLLAERMDGIAYSDLPTPGTQGAKS
jgi:hypothetical protein